MAIRALLWNIRGWASKEAELSSKINDYDVMFITETKSKKNHKLNMMGFDSYTANEFRQGEGRAGGVAILIRKEIKRTIIDLNHCRGNFDIFGIRILEETSAINFICVYRRPGRNLRRNAWYDIFQNVNTSEGIIVVDDFNAHNELWNCEKTDRIGESLLKELEQNDMFIVNLDTKSRQGEIGQKTPTWT